MRVSSNLKKAILFVLTQFALFLAVIFLVNWWFLDSLTVLSRKWLNSVRLKTDTDFANKIRELAKSKIAVVGIDPEFFEKESISIQWLHRWYYAQVLNNILKDNPDVVMVDVLFEKKFRFGSGDNYKILQRLFEEYDKQLAQSIDDRVVLGAVYDFKNKQLIKPEDDILGSGFVGHVKSFRWGNSDVSVGVYDILPPQGGILPLFLQWWLVAKQTTLRYLADGNIKIDMSFFKDKNYLKFAFNPNIKLPLSHYKKIDFVPVPIYFGNITNKALNYYSFWEVYYGRWEFKDKAVFIGAVDPALNDMELTLRWEIPGVGVHVNGYLAMLAQDFVHLPSPKEIMRILLALFLVNFLFVLFTQKNVIALWVLFVLEVIALSIASIVFASPFAIQPTIWLPFLTLLVAIVFYFLGSWLYLSWEKEVLANFMKSMLDVYVGKKIDRKISSNYLSPEARIAKVAVLFSDMEGFSTKVEKRWATKTISILNRYLTIFSDAIQQEDGNVDKFIGDAVMAFWEDEDWPQKAARAAIKSIVWIKQLSSQIQKEFGEPLNARVGLSFGEAILGDIGSKDRLDYTIIGDSVNVASRLEGINKVYWTNIIASENFVKALVNPDEFLIRWIDITKVKGRQQDVKIYEILPLLVDSLSQQDYQKLKSYINQFEKWVEAYHSWDLEQAKQIFTQLLQQWPEDKVVKFYLARIAGMSI